jgi:peptidoglycan/LPS O-acetylase OafA/YrhL
VLLALVLAIVGVGVLLATSKRGMAADYDLGFFRCLYGFFIGHLVFTMMAIAPRQLPCPTFVEIAAVGGIATFVTWAGGTPAEFAAPIVFAVAIWVFAQERGGVSGLLKSGLMRKLGLYSYSIYMVHAFVIAVVHRMMTVLEQSAGRSLSSEVVNFGQTARALSFGGAVVMDGVVMVYLAVVIGLAALAWRFIEMPCQAWFNTRQPCGGQTTAAGITQQAAD